MKLLVFTYAPAGLGHLRVTSALIHSKPKDIPYVLLGSTDKFITDIHRLTSVNFIARKIFEASQYGFFEDVFTLIYVWILRITSRPIFLRLLEIIDQHPDLSEMTVVATHFGLAHQISKVKDEIFKKTKVKINLIVQVTDDTSQHIWCVSGADLTFVPSAQTKFLLTKYANEMRVNFNCSVSPYPLSPVLTEKIPVKEGVRDSVFEKGDTGKINVIVPISGAAVGLNYFSKLLTKIDSLSSRFHFIIVAKRSSSTTFFLNQISKIKWVELVTGRNDNEVVRLYEKVYEENLIHLEITKPSEQAFKALISPNKIGGSILLFTSPVGRQELDNIDFLKRHSLLPAGEDQKIIPRGVSLPDDPDLAANLILWCLDKELFLKMANPNYEYTAAALMTGEVDEKGTWLFWEKLRLSKLI